MSRIICLITLFCVFTVTTLAQLRVGYYQSSCALAELIVKQEVLVEFLRDSGAAAGLIRLHFHDCFVRGCDGSVLLDPTPSSPKPEKQAFPNQKSLRGFNVINSAKAKIEAICKGVVSCADIIAFAARDSIQLTGGIVYDVPAGRKDGRVSVESEVLDNLPRPGMDVNELTRAFAKKGLNQEDMVTLSGAHSLGRSHCSSLNDRLYNFNNTSRPDPTLDPNYAVQLRQRCPFGNDQNPTVSMDPRSPAVLDSSGYYNSILANRSLFSPDQTLTSSPNTKAQVVKNAKNQILWAEKFAEAMVKMGHIDVLTGNAGEIRTVYHLINT